MTEKEVLQELIIFQRIKKIFYPQPPLRIFSDLFCVLRPGQKLPILIIWVLPGSNYSGHKIKVVVAQFWTSL